MPWPSPSAKNNDRALSMDPDYSRWPALKYERAAQLSAQLHHAFVSYVESLGPTTAVSIEGRYTAIRARIKHTAPTYEWSLIFGDIVHNYRAALDALAWAVAHLDGRQPTKPKDITFPIAMKEEEWSRIVKRPWLSDLPRFMQERFHSVQPYLDPDPYGAAASTLHELDIEDKHHASLTMGVFSLDARTAPLMIRSSRADTVARASASAEYPHQSGPIHDQDLMFRIELPEEDQADVMPFDLPLRLTTELRGQVLDAFHLIRIVGAQVALTIAIVEDGYESERAIEIMRAVTKYESQAASAKS